MKNALLVLAGIAVAVLLAEGVVRMLSPLRLGFVFNGEGFRNPPELSRTTPLPARNPRGFHERPLRPRAAGTRRVLLLGDSFVEGNSVDLDETLGSRLQVHLNDAGTGRWDVVSFGITGWGQAKQLEALGEHGAAADPDLVLTLFLHLNDLVDDSPELTRLRTRQKFQRIADGELLPDFASRPAPGLLVPWSLLNQLISHRIALAFPPDRPESIPVEYFVYAAGEQDVVWREAWALHESLLISIRREAGKLGAAYAIASASTPHGVFGVDEGLERMKRAYPGMAALGWDLDGPDRRMLRFCEAEGVPFLALEPIFREETARGARLHWRYDGHWNPEGNDLAARRIAEFVLGLGIEARACVGRCAREFARGREVVDPGVACDATQARITPGAKHDPRPPAAPRELPCRPSSRPPRQLRS